MGIWPIQGCQCVYGDGSAGPLIVEEGQTLDASIAGGLVNLPAGANLQFSHIEIAGVLILPSGMVLRSSGDITITGTVTVNPGTHDSGNGEPHPGRSLAAAGIYNGGVGLGELQASQILLPGPAAGGAGQRILEGIGGSGGGSVIFLAEGNISISGIVRADGEDGGNPQTLGRQIVGSGGGAGGIIVAASKGTQTINGVISAIGGNGANGWDGNGGDGAGGGGGGGGGIIHLISTIPPIVTGTIKINGGLGGQNASGVTGHIAVGGGGGACGGNGGNGGGSPIIGQAAIAAQSGIQGQFFQTIVPSPENLLIIS
ncbi:hypothetical protein [Neobacillus mesonae]|uniref:hypothetical protein n=1 Tax=Neobacillus mesonae TaxID=1193713 RepID=UPI00203ED223|nr:hypothetical protein [Neobacillus mesonae]MCM3570957.1 hypothetical protein [Neobacillus mesonae]